MKTNYIFLILTFLTLSAIAQEDSEKKVNQIRPEKFSLALSVKPGFGILNSENYKNFNGTVNGVDLSAGYNTLLNAASENRFRMNLGLSYQEFRASETRTKSLTIQYLQIPLKFSFIYAFENFAIRPFAGGGFVGNYFLVAKTETLEKTISDKGLGWTFGMLGELGFEFDVFENVIGSFSYDGQFSTKDSVNDSEKPYINSNFINLSFRYKF